MATSLVGRDHENTKGERPPALRPSRSHQKEVPFAPGRTPYSYGHPGFGWRWAARLFAWKRRAAHAVA